MFYALSLATVLSYGCNYIPEQNFKFPSMLDHAPKQNLSFAELIVKHRYGVAKSNALKPSVIFIGDVHSKPLRQRHCDFLKDAMQKNDVLLLEGYAGDCSYDDLHDEAFLKGEMPENLQAIIRKNANNITHGNMARQESYYKYLPGRIYGLEDSVLKAFQIDSFLGMIKKADNDILYDLYSKRHVAAFYHRNIAMARVIAKHCAESADCDKIYVILGIQHLLNSEELKQQDITLKSADLETLAGHVISLLETASLPYQIIIPDNMSEEKKKVDDDPTLRLDYKARKLQTSENN